MIKKAVDVVLLPDVAMVEKAIEANRRLIARFGEEIVLNSANCLPHISLAMGATEENDIGDIERKLAVLASETKLGTLRIIGISISKDANGREVSVFVLERTRELLSLHEQVMAGISPYFLENVAEDMVNAEKVSETTLSWIRNYAEKSAYARFLGHITIGYGAIEWDELPIEFTASKLALCHLGNHCTCTEILASVSI